MMSLDRLWLLIYITFSGFQDTCFGAVFNVLNRDCVTCFCPEDDNPVCSIIDNNKIISFRTFKNDCEFVCHVNCNEDKVRFMHCGECDNRPLPPFHTPVNAVDPSQFSCLKFKVLPAGLFTNGPGYRGLNESTAKEKYSTPNMSVFSPVTSSTTSSVNYSIPQEPSTLPESNTTKPYNETYTTSTTGTTPKPCSSDPDGCSDSYSVEVEKICKNEPVPLIALDSYSSAKNNTNSLFRLLYGEQSGGRPKLTNAQLLALMNSNSGIRRPRVKKTTPRSWHGPVNYKYVQNRSVEAMRALLKKRYFMANSL